MAAEKNMKEKLTSLKGVGDAKAQLLIDNGFTSMEKLQQATVGQLTKINGISENNAKDILDQVQIKTPAKSASKKPETPKKPEEKKEQPTKETKAKPKQPQKKETPKKTEPTKKEEEEVEIVEESKEIKVKKKPKLSSEQKEQLKKRKEIKQRTPTFLREEWYRYKRVPKNWRRPDGITSKMRKHLKYRPHVVRVGFRGPKEVRGLHASGFEEVMVFNTSDLENINPDTQAARISSTVGTKKRMAIAKKAEEKDIRVLNLGV